MNRGRPEGAPSSDLIFLLFLCYQWLDQATMNDVGEGGKGRGTDRTCFHRRPSSHSVGKTSGCCVRATEGWRKCGLGKWEIQWDRNTFGKGLLRSQWVTSASINMYVPLYTLSNDGPPGKWTLSQEMIASNGLMIHITWGAWLHEWPSTCTVMSGQGTAGGAAYRGLCYFAYSWNHNYYNHSQVFCRLS